MSYLALALWVLGSLMTFWVFNHAAEKGFAGSRSDCDDWLSAPRCLRVFISMLWPGIVVWQLIDEARK